MDTKNRKKTLIIAASVVFGLGVLYFGYEHFMYVTTDNAQVEAHAVLLAPKVPGFVTKVNVREGDKVKAGQVLVEIDDRDYVNKLKQAESELLSIEARKSEAEKNYKRLSSLFSNGAVSQQQFDTATSTYSDAKGKYEALSAGLAQAKLNLEQTKIVAPSDGSIAKESVEIGQLAAAGVPLIGFVASGERWVTANFKETEIGAIKVGASVSVDVDAVSGESYRGKVESISSATGATFTLLPPDNATGNFTKVVQRVPVKIVLENLTEAQIEKLRAGLSAFVKVRKH